MRMLIAIITVLFSTTRLFGFDYSIQGSQQGVIELLRATANEDPNADINSVVITNETAGDYAHRPAEVNGLKRLGDQTNRTQKVYIALMACARSAADKTFTTDVWLWYKDRGPAKKALSIAWTTGTQKVVVYPHSGASVSDSYWADTAVATSYWFTNIVSSANQGDNGVAIIVFDPQGADAIYCEVTNADGATGTEAGDVTVYWFCWS